jgi:hypothetical protein
MADFFKGLAGGFGTGLQFGQAMQQREERERLREAMGLTPQEMQQRQALPEELGRAQAETQALAAEDARMFGLGPQEQAAYAPQMPVEGQRVGLPRYQLAGQTYDRAPTQQEIQQARYGAMADVIAERDPARAMQMRQQLEEQAYQAKRRPLEMQQLEGSIAGQAQQRELTGIQLGSAKRTEAEQMNASNFSAFAAENPNLTTAELKDAAFKQFKFTPKQWQDAVNTRLGISKNEQELFVSGVKEKLKGKNLTQVGSIYNSDPDFDDKTDLAIVNGKNGAVTLNFIDKATKTITGTQSFKNEALALEYLNKQATEPETIGTWMMNLRDKEASIASKEASAAKDKALGGLYAQGGAGAGKGTFKQKVADFKEVYGRDPTEAEKNVLSGLVAKDPNKPEFNAKDYSTTVKNFTDAGFSQTDALIKADQLYGRGPNTAGEDAGLQKANAAKGGAPATATKPAVGLTPQQREQVKPAPQAARAPTTLDAIQSANLEAVSPLAAQFNQARAQLIQASQSKDPNAIAYYMNQQNALRKQLESEVSRRFGNNAPTVMQQLAGSM